MSEGARAIGVDTGGTFTDFVYLEDGELRIHKQLSTPEDPSRAVLAGLHWLDVGITTQVIHGSTVATNALLERRGARTALLTTAGFADVLAIGRQNRPDLYALVPQKPPPLVPAAWRFEVGERVTAQGEVLLPLQTGSLATIATRLAAEEIESVAVCLLFSYLRSEHEEAVRDYLLAAGLPALEHISLSAEILPEYREYERMATTVINAYVAPRMGRYLQRLEAGLAPRPVRVMQSNGGVISAQRAAHEAARTVLSGPAGGVVGAQYVAAQAGYEDIISFDMGGTSTDVALCPGKLPLTGAAEIANLPLRVPALDIHTVGAGGGSLAYLDAGGALQVGPESAGADPGPVCYGITGAAPARSLPVETGAPLWVTTTDANLVLGRLLPDHFLGGEMALHSAPARQALAALARVTGAQDRWAAAWAVVQVANATMERAIRRISVERGYDPRAFTLVAFGGAGPLHACELAESLQIPRVLVPAVPGVLSALGMLVAAPARDYARTMLYRAGSGDDIDTWLESAFRPLVGQASTEMGAEGYQEWELRRSLDMRYVGQSHELTVAYQPGTVTEAFHRAHRARYGYEQREAPVEVVTLRLQAVAAVVPPRLPRAEMGDSDPRAARSGQREVWFSSGPQTATLFLRDRLRAGNRFAGPAIVVQYDTTTVVPPGWQARVDGALNLVLECE
ncbi:MAG: hydantoinase/oxoprolinase family protein [Anaerolineae bacterium]|nr:hydantoinase/oxoprolinase family protein [Anaerolineae bacterium]